MNQRPEAIILDIDRLADMALDDLRETVARAHAALADITRAVGAYQVAEARRSARARVVAQHLTVEQAAERLHLSQSTVREYIHTGHLPATHLGTAVRIAEDDLQAFVARYRTGGDGQ